MLLTPEEQERFLWCLRHSVLVVGGEEYDDYHYENGARRRDGWYRKITRGPIRLCASYDRSDWNKLIGWWVDVLAVKGWFRFTDTWQAVNDDGPWWDVVRAELLLMEAEIRAKVTPSGPAAAATGNLSLIEGGKK